MYNDYSNKKILIVDDNKLNIRIASNFMKPYGFAIDEANSGLEALEKTKINSYDLIFLDIMMPEMDGIETLRNLKKLPNFNVPTIALTADAIEGSKEKCLNEGFNEYISKPINKQILDDIINKFINN